MGFTIGMPSLKLSNVVKDAKHSGLFRKVVMEALEERHGKDRDIDKSKTSENIYVTGFRTAKDLIACSDKFVSDWNAEAEAYNKENKCLSISDRKRKIRADAVVMCALIIKPPVQMMMQLSDEQQDQILKDALEKVKQIVGAENVKAAVIHKDELVRHMHIFWQPVTSDGRLCAKEMHNKKFLKSLNTEMPKYLREKGWYMVDDCKAYEEGSQEQKEAKRRAGRSSKVYKHEMDSIAEKIQAEQEKTHEEFTWWNARNKKAGEILEQSESLLADVDELHAEAEQIAQSRIQDAEEQAQQIPSGVAGERQQLVLIEEKIQAFQAEKRLAESELEALRKEAERLRSQAQESARLAEQSNRLKQSLIQGQEELRAIKAKQELAESEIKTLQQVAVELREENFTLQREQHKLIPDVEKLKTIASTIDEFAEQVELMKQPLPPEPEKPRKKFGESDASYQKRKTAYQDALKQYREELNKLPVIQKSDHLIERLQQMNWDLDDARNQAMKQIQTEYVEGKISALMRGMKRVALPDGSESVWSYYKKSIGLDEDEADGKILKALSAASLRYVQEQQRLAEEREMLLREQAERSRKIQLQDEASQPKREEEMLR